MQSFQQPLAHIEKINHALHNMRFTFIDKKRKHFSKVFLSTEKKYFHRFIKNCVLHVVVRESLGNHTDNTVSERKRPLSLSLSLSHTHIQIHSHTNTVHRKLLQCEPVPLFTLRLFSVCV